MARARHHRSLTYALDAQRRLVITDGGARRPGLSPVQVLAGRVTTDAGNRIVYELERPVDGVPSRVVFEGAWRLTPQQTVEFTGRRTDGPRGAFTLFGSVSRAEANALAVSVAGRGASGATLTISGRWRVDAQNRLTFLVDRGGRTDRLTLRGGWHVGPDHELAYQYRQALEGRRRISLRTVRFAGAWSLGRVGRLRYSLEGSDDAALELRGSLAPARMEASERAVGFRLGGAVSRSPGQPPRLSLTGQWRVQPDRSIAFEIPSAGGRRGTLRFAAAAATRAGQRLEVDLAVPRGERVGVAVRFTKRAFRNGRLFLQASRAGRDTAALGGVQVDF